MCSFRACLVCGFRACSISISDLSVFDRNHRRHHMVAMVVPTKNGQRSMFYFGGIRRPDDASGDAIL